MRKCRSFARPAATETANGDLDLGIDGPTVLTLLDLTDYSVYRYRSGHSIFVLSKWRFVAESEVVFAVHKDVPAIRPSVAHSKR